MNLGAIDAKTIADGIRKAIKEDPRRASHGDTRYNAFFIREDGEILGQDSVSFMPFSMPGDPAPDAVTVHSHSGENWRWYEKLTGEKEPFNPINAGDLKALKSLIVRGVANTMALIMADGRMQVLYVPPEVQTRFVKLGDNTIMKGREGTQEKRRELYFTEGLTLEDVEGTFLRDFARKYGLELYEGLRWKEAEPEPFIEKKPRGGIVPEKLWKGKPVETTASHKYYVSAFYNLIPPELWPVVPVQPELSIEKRGQKYTWKKDRPEPVQMRFFGLSQAQRELPLTIPPPEALDPVPEALESLAVFARKYDPKRIDPWMVVNTLRERYRQTHSTIPLPQSVKGKYPKPLENILAQYYGYGSGDPDRSIQAFWYHVHGYAPNGGPVPEVMLYPRLGFSGFGLAPASVWKSTLKDFTARTPKGEFPALSKELSWILQRTKVNPEGYLRVFRGRLPGHMKRRLEEWLSLRYRDPDKWLQDKRIKIDFHDGKTVDTYTIRHPYYFVAVSFYRKSGEVQVTEDRANYHADAVQQAIAEGKPVPMAVLQEYAPYMQEAEEAMYSSKSIPEQMRFFGLGNNGLSGRFFHCLTWQVNPYTGDLRCLDLAAACQAKEACVTVEPRGRLRVCVTPKMVDSTYYKKKIQRCAKYRPICGPGCITSPGPKPARVIEPKEKEIRAVAEWMAEEAAEDKPGYDPKLLAHEILSRGGLRAYRKQYPGQKTDEEYMELPLFLKKKTGLPPDEMASEMGLDGDVELYEAIHAAYPPKTAKTPLQKKLERRKPHWREFENRAYQYLITEQRREKGLEGRR